MIQGTNSAELVTLNYDQATILEQAFREIDAGSNLRLEIIPMTKEKQIQQALAAKFPADRLKTRLIDLHAYSSDASFYTLVPKAVVFPREHRRSAVSFPVRQTA